MLNNQSKKKKNFFLKIEKYYELDENNTRYFLLYALDKPYSRYDVLFVKKMIC